MLRQFDLVIAPGNLVCSLVSKIMGISTYLPALLCGPVTHAIYSLTSLLKLNYRDGTPFNRFVNQVVAIIGLVVDNTHEQVTPV
jgi:hypothetical protein